MIANQAGQIWAANRVDEIASLGPSDGRVDTQSPGSIGWLLQDEGTMVNIIC